MITKSLKKRESDLANSKRQLEILSNGMHTVSLQFASARYKSKIEWKQVIYTEK